MGSFICFFFFNVPYSVIKGGGVKSGLDGSYKETPIILRILFGVKQIIDSLLLLFLLTHIGQNFKEKVFE